MLKAFRWKPSFPDLHPYLQTHKRAPLHSGGARRSCMSNAGDVAASVSSGDALWVVGDRYVFKATADETGGAFTLMDTTIGPGHATPVHTHAREIEAFYVMEGELDLVVSGVTTKAKPGTLVHVAPGVEHAYVNSSSEHARVLVLVVSRRSGVLLRRHRRSHTGHAGRSSARAQHGAHYGSCIALRRGNRRPATRVARARHRRDYFTWAWSIRLQAAFKGRWSVLTPKRRATSSEA